ncbi:PhnA domain-containing protein [Shewanella surugensis]|uniref:PhnA domain-containing protein n=1 Tax=Shewanella surugensis TaxID=212020 RepID=A0ABT0LCY1_9GAMM|nr:alkylphosphonate utilization protein [Shewanella surugensis]MCL1125031.1 PhnA domain-containing protein [Shewanella surugensis]
MTTELLKRCEHKCELCGAASELAAFSLPHSGDNHENELMICHTCNEQIMSPEKMDTNHWRCLNDSMWSPVSAVQVMAARMLKRLNAEGWAQDLAEMLYLDDNLQAWVDAEANNVEEETVVTVDSNGAVLEAGDNIVIIKDLNVKGTSFVAKRGTAVRNIALTNNPEHIEGRVNGTRIVILTCFVKKSQ